MKRGMKAASSTIIECVGPLWFMKRKSMSASGIIESVKTRGRLIGVLVRLAVALASM